MDKAELIKELKAICKHNGMKVADSVITAQGHVFTKENKGGAYQATEKTDKRVVYALEGDALVVVAGVEDEQEETDAPVEMTVVEIKEALTAKGIEYDAKAKKAALIALLESAEGDTEE